MYRVFIVEDDTKIAEGMVALINSWGMEAKAAEA